MTALLDRETDLRSFMTMATHDLKSPLAAASAHLEMLREDHAATLGEQGGRDLDGIDRGLRRMERLVEDLLHYARADQVAVVRTPVRLAELVADIVAGHATADIVAGDLPVVRADAKLLHHLLDNLIGNAVKYTPAGSVAQVRVSARVAADSTVRVEVADRGIGIPAGDRPYVFDAFRRSANSGAYRGTSLGLAICRRIVERHHGRIGVDANPGGGSLFWFTLPA